METLFPTETQKAMQFPASLTEVYKPQTLDDPRWCGLEKQRKILANLAANVRLGSVVLLEGPPGVGKTSLAFAFARVANCEIFHISSQQANIATLQEAERRFSYVPMAARYHCLIVDEISNASQAFQLACLSKFDGTAAMNAITIMTCNESTSLEPKFLSRCIRPPVCNAYGASKSLKTLMQNIWKERAGGAPEPDWSRVSTSCPRESLNWLDCELMAAS
jgi:replication-associated recombination protein RarA